MFDSGSVLRDQSKHTTRRLFLIAGAAAAAYVTLSRLSRLHVEASETVHGTPGSVTIVNFSDSGSRLGEQTAPKILKSDRAWLDQLGKNSFQIARQADTEMPFTGVSWREHRHGLFRCICCGTALFNSQTKFESGTGWPSFYQPIARENISEREDLSLGMARTEVRCTRCEAHLGHVFNDGPEPTGLRYCMNSASMHFVLARQKNSSPSVLCLFLRSCRFGTMVRFLPSLQEQSWKSRHGEVSSKTLPRRPPPEPS